MTKGLGLHHGDIYFDHLVKVLFFPLLHSYYFLLLQVISLWGDSLRPWKYPASYQNFSLDLASFGDPCLTHFLCMWWVQNADFSNTSTSYLHLLFGIRHSVVSKSLLLSVYLSINCCLAHYLSQIDWNLRTISLWSPSYIFHLYQVANLLLKKCRSYFFL